MAILKLLLKIIGYGIVLIFLLIATYIAYDTYKRHKRIELENKIEIKYIISNPLCDKEYPYSYTVKNNSKKIVDSVEFYIEARKIGYSTVINGSTSFKEDKILKPGEQVTGCFYISTSDYPRKKIKDKDVNLQTSSKYIEFNED